MTSGDRPVLLAYDGSDDARDAIQAIASLLGRAEALVAHVYQPLVELLAGGDVELPDSIATEAAEAGRMDREEAEATAAEGCKLARSAGLDATALVAKGSGSVWPTLLTLADAHDARLVVTGSRGLSGFSRVLGSVSAGVLHHCHRPVLVVPPSASASAGGRRGGEAATGNVAG